MRAKSKRSTKRKREQKTDVTMVNVRIPFDAIDTLSEIGARADELYALCDAAMTYRADGNDRVVGCLIYCAWRKADELVKAARKFTFPRKSTR